MPAPDLDGFIVSKIRAIANDPGVLSDVAAAARGRLLERIPTLRSEIAGLETGRQRMQEHLRLAVEGVPAAEEGSDPNRVSRRVADIEHRMNETDRCLDGLRAELNTLETGTVDPTELRAAVRRFDEVWAALFPAERARIIRLLVERVAYDPDQETVAITYRPDGPRALVAEAVRGGADGTEKSDS